jgi:hypothetical protein
MCGLGRRYLSQSVTGNLVKLLAEVLTEKK